MEDPQAFTHPGLAYRAGIAEGVLRYQRCEDCGAPQTLARYACQRCFGSRLVWRNASGEGIVHAVTVVTRAPSEDFRALVPYALVLVDLIEGPRVMAHGAAGLAIGDAVRATPLRHAGKALIRFQRLAATESQPTPSGDHR